MLERLKKFVKASPAYPYLKAVQERRHYRDSDDELIYIHIGKCGGASVRHAIENSADMKRRFRSVSTVHVMKPPILRKSRYIIVVRNPISRALSAFNWRYKLVVETEAQRHRLPGEYEALTRYGTLNAMAEALYVDGLLVQTTAAEFRRIHHLKEDIAFYLSDLLTTISVEQIYAVLTTEFLDLDIERYLSVSVTRRTHENRSSLEANRLWLSDTARENLRRFLNEDYAVLGTLSEMVDLDRERREKLLN